MVLTPAQHRRRAKRWRILGAFLALGFVATLIYFTRPSTLAGIILPRATRAIGGEVSASRVALGGINKLVIEDLRVRAPGWDGESGEILYADRIEIKFSLLRLLIGDLRVNSVKADRLDLRLTERADSPGEFSLLSLKPHETEPDAKSSPPRPSEISIDELIVENGIVTREGYRKLGDLRFQGRLTPKDDGRSEFDFRLSGRPDADGRLSIGSISGSFDGEKKAVAVDVDGFDIDGTQLAVAPIAVRAWTTRLGVAGRIPHAKFRYAPGTEPTAELDLEGVATNIPVDALGGEALAGEWAGFANGKKVDLKATPRMTLRHGSLRLNNNEVRFDDVSGELGADGGDRRVIPVPFTGAFSLKLPTDALPAFEWESRDTWFAAAARAAPFSIALAIHDFSSPTPAPGAADTLQLPTAVTKILSDFNITKWTLDIETKISRGEPSEDGEPAPIRSSGLLKLAHAAGSYSEFPYNLDEVSGTISYADDNLVIDEMVATGAEGSHVSLTGRLDGLSKGAEIDLNITCADAPIDERLFAAFDSSAREALELLFDARAARSLGDAGLLPDAGALVTQRQELARLPDADATRLTRARLERSIAAGAFALGGRCGFTIRVYSPEGFGQPVFVTGDVRVRDAGLVFGNFPYPLRLKYGEIRVLDEAIEIVGGGIKAITPAGGEFVVAGKVEIPRQKSMDGKTERGMRPLIRITDTNDAINGTLLAAIPHDGDEIPAGWPGKTLSAAGEFLESLGLSGRVQLEGTVDSTPDNRENFTFKIAFDEGTAAPSDAGRARLEEKGLPWPPEFTLKDCKAALTITPERVVLEDCEGRAGAGLITSKGFVEIKGPASQVELTLKSVPVGRAFQGYLAEDSKEAAARFDKYKPTGSIDGTLRREVTAASAETKGSLTPQFIELELDGSRVRADRIAGRVAIEDDDIRAESMEFRLSEGTQDDGLLRISGPLSTNSRAPSLNPPATLDIAITGGRFESPALRGALAGRADGVIELLRARAVKGLYDARYTQSVDEHIEITPRQMTVGQPDARVEMSFAPTDKIEGDSKHMRFDLHGALTGAHAGTIAARGSFDAGTDNRITASLAIDSAALTPALRKQLPPPLDDATEAIDMVTAGRFKLDLPDIELRWPSSGSADKPDVYQLRGEARLEGAAFNAGTRISAIDGTMPIYLHYEPRAAKPTDLRSTLRMTGARIFDRAIGESTIDLTTDQTGDILHISANGDVAFGRFDVVGDVNFNTETFTSRVRIADADYDILGAGKPAKPGEPRSKGRMAGVVSFAGSTTGSVDSRTGSGRVGIRNASLASMPVALRVLQITQLMLPTSSAISDTDAELKIRGNTAEITQCELTSGTIRLAGTGTIDIPTLRIGMRLFPRGTVPIVSDVIGGVTNQFFAIDLSGTLSEPKATLTALPGMTEKPTAPSEPPPTTPPTSPAPPATPSTPPATTPPAPVSASKAPSADETKRP